MTENSNLKYECSDKMTNEALKDSGSNTTKQIIFTALNMGLDILFILFNAIAFIYLKRIDFFSYNSYSCSCDCICLVKKSLNIMHQLI